MSSLLKDTSPNKTPQELGASAYQRGINAAVLDTEMMTWLKDNTSGKVGSGLKSLKEWNNGWHDEKNAELKKEFPEFFPV